MSTDVEPSATAAGVRAVPPLRILLVLKTSQGGMWVLPHIDELRRRGHSVIVVLPAESGRLRAALQERGVPLTDSPFDFRFRPSPGALAGLLRLRHLFRRLSPDVLHYHLYASALAARLAGIGLGVPKVHMVAGPLYLESGPIRTAERLLSRLDSVTIGGSEFTARRYRELGRPHGRYPAIPYGLDTQYFQPLGERTRTGTRTILGVDQGSFVVVMIALVYAPKRLVCGGRGIKGHDVLISAWRKFHAEHPDSRLILVGSGFDEAGERYRQQLIHLLRLDDDTSTGITWLDTTDDVRPYYAAADLSVSPSLSDNHGAAVEAGAMGLPSVVSDAGGLPEAVPRDGGWVVPRGNSDALAQALAMAHGEHVRRVLHLRGARARQHILTNFSGSRVAQAIADTIEEAAGRPATGRVFSLFTDARFIVRGGGWVPVDPANGPSAREGYLRDGNRIRVVARSEPLPGGSSFQFEDGSELRPLPYYHGGGGLLAKLVPLTTSVVHAVADADAVLLRLPGAVGSVAAAACRALNRRYAVEVVGDPAEVLRSGALGAAGRRLAGPAAGYLRWVVRGASASRFVTSKTLQRRYPPRPGTPTMTIPNVRLSKSMFVDQGRHWSPGPFRLVAIGSHETRYKGHDVLLKAIRLLLDDEVPVTAAIAGDGRIHHELLALGRSAGLTGHVTFTGTLDDRATVIDLLDSASLFVMPSRTEGLPRALVEAMARALPAVGSAVGGIPELLDRSCLVPADDEVALAAGIRRLISNPREWETQSRRNLAVARDYEQSVLDERLTSWLRDVPSARSRR
ncbi:glycosyltransferase [Amycolatopsis pithecellobii]|uniref:Glycosyltransferase n=1 Tax=Amycolatopsis pithecellobii TaxID=664692 RepID=A0A6N7Z6A7_9PSEU|nr:glycosyltransferase [Amycolatopsis pithecellobii]MTD58033.1 glycosyltransferase [Amycolatopsis pithecellobii]